MFVIRAQFGGDQETRWDENSISIYEKAYRKIVGELIEKDDFESILRMGNITSQAARIHNRILKNRYCNAGKSLTSISAKGKLFPCHRFTDMDGFEMGSLDSPIMSNGSKAHTSLPIISESGTLRVKEIQTDTLFSRDQTRTCSSCWLKYQCGGGCYYTNYVYGEHPTKTYDEWCSIKEVDLEIGIWFYCMLSVFRPNEMDRLAHYVAPQ